MQNLDKFMEIITGNFNNQQQFNTLKQQGVEGYPYAEHVITICNNKISSLPQNFEGYFALEESYYTLNNHTNAQPRLFLFTAQGDNVLLTSYDLPSTLNKEKLNYEEMPNLQYKDLAVSEKFTPALFIEKNGTWVGESESMFTPILKFTLKESFSKEKLVVSEVMEKNGVKTFGFEPPIEYKRVV